MKKVYSICEYEYFSREKEIEDSRFCPLPAKDFDLLLKSILSYPSKTSENNLQDFFLITQKRNVGTVIQALNYVGAFLLSNGVSIEILPKIIENHHMCREQYKIFLEMVKVVWNLPFKNVEEASLAAEKKGFFQWFIALFIRETELLVKKGLCSDYLLEQSNEVFLKGKLIFSKHITQNVAHKERFYVEKDIFSEDRAENRLIKSALLEVNKIADIQWKTRIKKLLSYFNHINPSNQIPKDIESCKRDRNSKRYEKVLEWCKIILNQKKFSMFYGNEQFLSLFFPMDQLFERYVAKQIFYAFHTEEYRIEMQIRKTYLLDSIKKQGNEVQIRSHFELIPDIAIWKGNKLFLLDTKWKLLKINQKNYGISQEDIYQMFAYGRGYHAEKVIMLYPKREITEETIVFSSKDNCDIKVIWVDLLHMSETLDKIKKELE